MDDVKKELKEIQKSINNIDITLARQNVSLEEHMRRTELLENKIDPLQAQINQALGAVKFLTIISVVVGVISALIKLFN